MLNADPLWSYITLVALTKITIVFITFSFEPSSLFELFSCLINPWGVWLHPNPTLQRPFISTFHCQRTMISNAVYTNPT